MPQIKPMNWILILMLVSINILSMILNFKPILSLKTSKKEILQIKKTMKW